jgi:hypothetical protein
MTGQSLIEMNCAASADQIMAAHPSSCGWHRIESRSCGGQHGTSIPGSGRMVLWRRERQYFNDDTFELLEPAADPPLWVAQRVSTAPCVTQRWVRCIRKLTPLVAEGLGIPWSISAGEVGPGSTVVLTVANGRWVWELTGDPAPCLRRLCREVG